MTGILNRLGSAISASIHDALDKVETPDSVIKQLVRDSTDNITRARTLAIDAVASEKRLAGEISKLEASITALADDARSTFANGDESAARSALERKIEAEKLLLILKPQHEKALSNSEALKIRLKDLEKSLARLKSKKAAIIARQKGADALRESDNVASKLLSQSDLEGEELRVEDMVADLEARNAAISEIESFTQPQISRQAQQDADQLERELNALRNQ